MGKNPHANRDKKKKFTEKGGVGAEEEMQELKEEAARRGIEIWQLQDELKDEKADSSSEEDEQIDSSSKKPKNDVIQQ